MKSSIMAGSFCFASRFDFWIVEPEVFKDTVDVVFGDF